MQDSIQELVASVSKLAAIPSTADNPAALRAAYEYVRSMVQSAGKDLTIEEFAHEGKPSFIAFAGPERPERFHLLLNAHVDVVPGKQEQFTPYVEDGRLYGRGMYDMKAAAVVLAQVFCEYADNAPYTLGLQLTTDEEHGGVHGTRYQIAQGVQADLVLCGESGRALGTYEIANEAKGTATVELAFTGRVAHGAYPWQGDNAAAKAAHFVTELRQAHPTPQAPTGDTTLTVVSINSGGVAHNQVPDTATVTVNCRYAPGDSRFASKEAIIDLFRSIDPTATITNFLSLGRPAHANPGNPFLLALKAAAEETERHDFALVRRNGASDGRHYAEVGGQAIEFGIAGSGQHADNEHITIEALESYQQTMHAFLQKTLG